ncbi:hypothetical protein LTR36_008267 [Oleoguttula mirabilis]|uniref:Alpha/beta hydrolase fold-3 domain-containing protein n=1 Tax=Oleoguttula mirabilis TaxID=1507867 RepID=A0AAV9J833_9PEZI|nr:hypothetical protein LTR36_008267 [Oleoguttula mirabilis]
MPFNTLSVATAVTPSVIETYFSHYLNRGPLRQKPTAHISYHEGLRLIRQFLDYSSKHGVEDLQAFTAQWVPAPTWVRIQDSEIAPQFLERAAHILHAQLGRRGLEKIGGKTWWQWRRPEAPLRAEWIEMKKDFHERKRAGTKCERVILYVHGGAYYFGSVDEHRYQMQRHARKMKARVLAPRYRLAPQFPFPCGLYDCIATYLYLLEHFAPSQILFAGDSAGGGMVLSMLVTLRDQGFPLPAGTILLSPWVDLTHSFPSVAGDGVGDYIPPHGFHHKPSMAWPPPPSDQIKKAVKTYDQPPSDAVELPVTEQEGPAKKPQPPRPTIDDNMSITLDGKMIEIKEQIQLYTPNDLLSHPLVSPVMQPSLGGLPPMLIQVGGGELLRDEQIYIAHKAANPKAFPPGDAVLNEYDPRRELLDKYPPTDVQLQVWEDLCHVPHTLSFTRPAKYMYRSVAQFGAWALAHAQQKGIEIQDDDAISIISSGPEDGDDPNASSSDLRRRKTNGWPESTDRGASSSKSDHLALGAVGKAGDPLPPFKDHMVRQRVTRHGIIYPLAPQAEIACLALDPASIGTIKPGPVRKWLAKKRENDAKYGSDKKKIQKKRAKELVAGYDSIPGETPPPTALVGRRKKGVAPEEKKKGKSWGLAMWSGWGSHHDESTLEREEKFEASAGQAGGAEKTVQPRPENAPPSTAQSRLVVPGQADEQDTKKKRRTSNVSMLSAPWTQKDKERPRSPYRQVTDTGQTGYTESGSPQFGGSASGSAGMRTPYTRRSSNSTSFFASRPVSVAVPPTAGALAPDSVQVPGSQNTYLDPASNRPHNGVVAYPFKLRNPMQSNNASVATIDSQAISAMSNSDASAGPIEMPTPADERSSPFSAAGQAEPASAISTASSSVPAAPWSGAPQSAAGEASSPVLSTPLSAAAFKPFDPVFQHRTSVLGSIGADGMPNAPLLARIKTVEKPTDPASALSALEGSPAPVSPVDGSNAAAPFKLRNPVFDSRASSTTANGPAYADTVVAPVSARTQTPTPPLPLRAGEATEATKAAPFKMRHAVVDPLVARAGSRTPDSARSAASTPPPPHAEKVAKRAMTPVEAASSCTGLDLPPNSNVVMPTVVARRPMTTTQTAPPRPPPKDEWRKTASLDRKPSVPRSKFNNAPLLDDLNFSSGNEWELDGKGEDGREKRPGLESFVTANEGDLRRTNV